MWIRICLSALLLLLLSGCGGSPTGPALQVESPPGPDTVVVDQNRNGDTVTLRSEQTLLIRLPEEPARGMTWEMQQRPDESVLMPDGQRTVRSGRQIREGSLLSYQELRFQAQEAGQTQVQLAYDQPKLGDASITRQFTLTVIVEAGSN